MQYSSINGNGFGGYGETVLGTEGTLLLETEKDVMLYKGSDLKSKARVVDDPKTENPVLKADNRGRSRVGRHRTVGHASPAERGYTAEIEHWAWCIRNGDAADPEGPQPRCHPKVAMGDAVIALTTNICRAYGRTHGLRSRLVRFPQRRYAGRNQAGHFAVQVGCVKRTVVC